MISESNGQLKRLTALSVTRKPLNRRCQRLLHSEAEILNASKFEEVRNAWAKIILDSFTTSKRLAALFSIIARNDRSTAQNLLSGNQRLGGSKVNAIPGFGRPDGVLRRIMEILEDNSDEQVWGNSAVISCVVGFFVCLILMVGYFCGVETISWYWSASHVPVENRAAMAILGEFTRDGLTRSATIFFGFTLSSLVALFIRSVRIEEGDWKEFSGFAVFPLSNYYTIIGWCSLTAFVPIMMVYVFQNYDWSGPGEIGLIGKLPPGDIALGLVFRYFLGFASVAFAVGTCILADLLI